MFIGRAAVEGQRISAEAKGRGRSKSRDPLSLDLAELAPAGHYLALRIGFAFPLEEVNRLPAPWVEEYTRRGYALFDPLIRWVYSERGASRWSAIGQADVGGILARAAAHGLRFGAIVSVLDDGSGGHRSYGSIAHSDREFTDEEIERFAAFVRARHDALLPPRNITEAEIEALRLVKEGQRLKQIAFQLGVTEGAVKQRLKNARVKLSAKTGAEAISRAASFGLI
jgi:DNA-binding CsgD family transcriptional regulator